MPIYVILDTVPYFDTIKYVELLMEAIVGKEIEIRKKHEKILTAIQEELENNQDEKEFHYSLPSIKEIEGLDRMDSSLYSKAFKEKEFLITNYKHGYASLTDLGYYGVRGTSLENNFIKNRIDSDEYVDGFYKLIIPTNISELFLFGIGIKHSKNFVFPCLIVDPRGTKKSICCLKILFLIKASK